MIFQQRSRCLDSVAVRHGSSVARGLLINLQLWYELQALVWKGITFTGHGFGRCSCLVLTPVTVPGLSEDVEQLPVLYSTATHDDFRKYSRHSFVIAKPPKDTWGGFSPRSNASLASTKACTAVSRSTDTHSRSPPCRPCIVHTCARV